MMKVLLEGYSGYALIGGNPTLMTSFSVTKTENIIESGGIGKILSGGRFKRSKLNVVRDYPSYEISVSCDAQQALLDYLLKKITDKYYSFISLEFHDDASGIHCSFSDCCLTSFQLGVELNSAATVSIGLQVFTDSIGMSFGDHNAKKKHNANNRLVGAVLMPYYRWGVAYPDFKDEDLVGFSVSYSQQVTPKFECCASTSNNAIKPKKIIFGLPAITYELTYLVYHKTKTNYYDIHSNNAANSNKTLKVKYNKGFDFEMTNCYPDSYSPQLANSGDANKVTIAGTCYGKIKY